MAGGGTPAEVLPAIKAGPIIIIAVEQLLLGKQQASPTACAVVAQSFIVMGWLMATGSLAVPQVTMVLAGAAWTIGDNIPVVATITITRVISQLGAVRCIMQLVKQALWQ